MMLIAIKNLLLAFVLTASCSATPDEFEIGYGRIFPGDFSGGFTDGWDHSFTSSGSQDDSDMLTIGFVWKLKPTRVEVMNPVAPPLPPVRWELDTFTQDPPQVETAEAVEAIQDLTEAVEAETEEMGQVTDALETFNAFDWLTRVLLILALGFIAWLFRAQLARWIPGSGNGRRDSDKK